MMTYCFEGAWPDDGSTRYRIAQPPEFRAICVLQGFVVSIRCGYAVYPSHLRLRHSRKIRTRTLCTGVTQTADDTDVPSEQQPYPCYQYPQCASLTQTRKRRSASPGDPTFFDATWSDKEGQRERNLSHLATEKPQKHPSLRGGWRGGDVQGVRTVRPRTPRTARGSGYEKGRSAFEGARVARC
ncbi:hypothetical protein BV20DRAFT_311505 [Pilatotrama ljubarskyi]|nr:hypothetical protein BV20DRAFT_311505 [Pilatotrama ljubarskyi]